MRKADLYAIASISAAVNMLILCEKQRRKGSLTADEWEKLRIYHGKLYDPLSLDRLDKYSDLFQTISRFF